MEMIHKMINEEFYGGNIATVYHQTYLQPEDFLKIIKNDEFRGQFGVLGKGLYSVLTPDSYIIKNNHYGYHTYKLKINLSKYIIFDRTIAYKLRGFELIEPIKQIEKIYGPDILKKIRRVSGNDEELFDMIDVLKMNVKGIIHQDVVVTFDPSTVVPIEYIVGDPAGEKWIKLPVANTPKELLRRSALDIHGPNKSEADQAEKKMIAFVNEYGLFLDITDNITKANKLSGSSFDMLESGKVVMTPKRRGEEGPDKEFSFFADIFPEERRPLFSKEIDAAISETITKTLKKNGIGLRAQTVRLERT